MKILAPVNNIESASHQIESGADELYVGLKDDIFKKFSFTGRGKTTHNTDRVLPDKEELTEIVNEAHKNKVDICFAANSMFLYNDIDNGNLWEKYFLKYVETGLQAGVDALILGDLGSLLLINQEGIKTNLIAGNFFETLNTEQLKLLKELGICRAVLPYTVTLEDIKALAYADIIDVEVFGHYGCSFHDGCCNLKHDMGESSIQHPFKLGTPCRNFYDVHWRKGDLYSVAFLNASLTCSICSLKDLKAIGVHSIKIVGRTQPWQKTSTITNVYSDFLKALDRGGTIEDLKRQYLPSWWEIGFCRTRRCKYIKNETTAAYVGMK
jgi:putative protease